jgi:GNAT superfamily N-acetyltransferase
MPERDVCVTRGEYGVDACVRLTSMLDQLCAPGVSRAAAVIEDPPDPVEVAQLEMLVATAMLETAPSGSRGGEFTVIVRSGTRMIGGIYAATFGRTCELQHLFVDPQHRHLGIGRRVLQAAEREAAARGCRQVVLFTHASLGGRYYPRLGYTLLARVEDYPDGDAALWFRKDITPGHPSSRTATLAATAPYPSGAIPKDGSTDEDGCTDEDESR